MPAIDVAQRACDCDRYEGAFCPSCKAKQDIDRSTWLPQERKWYREMLGKAARKELTLEERNKMVWLGIGFNWV